MPPRGLAGARVWATVEPIAATRAPMVSREPRIVTSVTKTWIAPEERSDVIPQRVRTGEGET